MYTLSQDNINEVDHFHRTGKYLPRIEDIPKEFFNGNIYTKIIEAWYVGEKIPDAVISFNIGFEHNPKKVKIFIMSHLSDWDSSYDHRVAGTGFMLSKIFTITEK